MSLGTIQTNRNVVRGESRRRIHSGNVCFYSVGKLSRLSTLQDVEDEDIKKKSQFLSVGIKSCFLLSRGNVNDKFLETRFGKYLALTKIKLLNYLEYYIRRKFVICTGQPVLLDQE